MLRIPAVIAAACLAVAAATDPTTHLLLTHTIPPLPSPVGTLPPWQCGGICRANSDGTYNLLNSFSGAQAILWNPVRLDLDQFDLELDLHITGAVSEAVDGFGLWLSNTTVIDELVRYGAQPGTGPWNLLGFTNRFGGWGVAFGARDRKDEQRQSVSLLVNRGRGQAIDPIVGVPSGAGIYWNYKNPSVDTTLKLRMASKGDDFWGMVKLATDKDWQRIFSVKRSAEGLERHKGYLVFTGSNARPVQKAAVGLSVSITRLIIQVDGKTSTSPRTAMTSLVEQAKSAVNEGNVAGGLSALIDLLADHVLPNQHAIEFSMLQSLQSAVNDVQGSLARTSGQYMSELQAVRAKMDPSQGIEEIKENAQILENSVRAAQSVTHWSTVILGCVFVGFGLVIYKRMADIEKKHYL